ncbi:MAG: phosphoenolpyruvate kinase [Blastocatellia bacterium]|nr:phosphoenolpyruvate kinase [Blastocatellia bacterium]
MSNRTTLSDEFTRALVERLGPTETRISEGRQPVHVVYGGAHLFKADTIPKLGRIARSFFETYASDSARLSEIFGIDAAIADRVFELVTRKLEAEPVEDFRIDFEDGYGPRTDAEEDAHAEAAARETNAAMEQATLPPFFGIRIKPLSGQSSRRAIRTLDIYLSAVTSLPERFVVTLPKITSAEQVAALADLLDEIESKRGIREGSIGIELMIETPQSILTSDGRIALPSMVEAGRGRVRSAHFGAYDYTASLGITAAHQDMRHAASDFARHMMQASLAETSVHISDGANSILPIPPHRGDDLTESQRIENHAVVERAWRLHYDLSRRSLANGFFQGWDLHPAQIPARYAAVFAFFFEEMDSSAARLRNFIDQAARATLVGDVFDDAATGQGLLNFFVRAIDAGAVSEDEVSYRTGIEVNNVREGSFAKIVRGD